MMELQTLHCLEWYILFALIVVQPAVCTNNRNPDSPELRVLLFSHLSSLCRRWAKRITPQTHQSLEFYSFCTYRRPTGCVQKNETTDSPEFRVLFFVHLSLLGWPCAKIKELQARQSLEFYSFCVYRRYAGRVQEKTTPDSQELRVLFFEIVVALPAMCKKNRIPDSPELIVLLFLHLSSFRRPCAKKHKNARLTHA